MIESSGAVRYAGTADICLCNHLQVPSSAPCRALHWEHCPVSATADLVILELHAPGKLRADSLATHHILRAPRSPGTSPMAGSTLTGHLGTLLREAGVLGLTQRPLCSLPTTERCI